MAPRTSEQLEEVRELSRNKILDAALKLFAERGYHNTSISQLTQEAGVSKGLLYNYFDSKKALLDGIVGQAMAEGEEVMREMMKLPEPSDQLRFILEQAFQEIIERKEHYKLMLSLSLQIDQFPEIKEIVLAKYKGTVPFLAPLLEAVGIENAEEESYVLAALIDGVGTQATILGDAMPIEKIKHGIFERYNLNPKKLN